jgi:transposase
VAVDSLGLIWALFVTGADVQDRVGGVPLVRALRGVVKYIQMVWVDSHFDTAIRYAWIQWGWPGEVVRRLRNQVGFAVLPKRWIVERTFGWLNRYRRLAKDYERTIESSEAFVKIAMIRLMLRRLRPESS